MIIFKQLILGGSESSTATFNWMLLFIAYYPDIQQKLRNEIQSEIGNNMPLIEDKIKLNFCMAFISEILRFRNPGPIGFPHKALSDSKLGKLYFYIDNICLYI